MLIRHVIQITSTFNQDSIFNKDSTYLIAGGLGGLGRDLTRWLVRRGARNLILLSRSGARSPAAKSLVAEIIAHGVHVETPTCDVTDKQALERVLKQCGNILPPIKGCIQASMVSKVFSTPNLPLAYC